MSARVGDAPSRTERRAEQRRRILDAARGVFFRDGFVKANLDEVAEVAGVAKGTLYRYFESKAEMYVAILSADGEIFVEKMRESVADKTLPPDERIRRVSRFYLGHWSENREYFQIFWAMENQPVIGELPPGVVAEVTRLWEQCLGILAEVVQEGLSAGRFRECDPWAVANILWTLANGIIGVETSPVHRKLRAHSLEETYHEAVEFVIAGLLPLGEQG